MALGDRLAQQINQRIADAVVRDTPGREKKFHYCAPCYRISGKRLLWLELYDNQRFQNSFFVLSVAQRGLSCPVTTTQNSAGKDFLPRPHEAGSAVTAGSGASGLGGFSLFTTQ